jgi:hypothetical protein
MTNSIRSRTPRTDRRLLGTWKSDDKRTLKEWTWKRSLSARKRKKFKSIFGKLEVTYTRTKISSRLGPRDWESWRRYSVLAADETSVAILEFGNLRIKNSGNYDPLCMDLVKELCSKPAIHHIHFEGEHYWISLGKNREFFRKIRNEK